MVVLSQEEIKKKLGVKAATLMQNGMKIGLGTGSTAAYFIEALAQKLHERTLTIQATASSEASAQLAKKWGIPLQELDTLGPLDVTVDGADEIDPSKRMIKGGGGAHVHEKIVAAASKELIILVDESKLVHNLGETRALPIEVLSFGKETTKRHIDKLGMHASWRLNTQKMLFLSDGGNPILDVRLPHSLENPESLDQTLRNIPGVLDTGFFFHLAGRVLVGFADGQITIR